MSRANAPLGSDEAMSGIGDASSSLRSVLGHVASNVGSRLSWQGRWLNLPSAIHCRSGYDWTPVFFAVGPPLG
jgi:hypothetical protein